MRSPEKYLINDPEPLRATLAKTPGVQDVMGRLYFSGLLNNGRSDLPILGEGVEPTRENKLGSSVIIKQGRMLEEKDSNGVIIGQGLAHALKLKPGDVATLVINTPDGALNSLEFVVIGVFQTFSNEYDARAVRIPLSAAQDLLATTGINIFVLSLKETRNTESVAAIMAGEVARDGLEVKTWLQLNEFYTQTVEMYDAQFGVLRLIILLLVLLSVANGVNMSIFERIGEFGTMMALGNRGSSVFTLILKENLIIGIIGAAVGVVLGVVLAVIISAIGIPMPPPPNSDLPYTGHVLIVPMVILSSFAVGLIATVGASLLPAFRVRRIPVVDSLGENI
jgi:putative ABC transport system permease protein